MNTLKIFRDHHYSAFDITQNFELNISSWKNKRVSPITLSANGILFSPDYFKNEQGNEVSRSFYDFVRDHLGYRLNLIRSSFKKENSNTFAYSFELTNTGFSTVLNPKGTYIVLIDDAGNIVHEANLGLNMREWQPFEPTSTLYKPKLHSVSGSITTTLKGNYKVGLWFPEENSSLKYNSDYAIRLVQNAVVSHWEDSSKKYIINVIGDIIL